MLVVICCCKFISVPILVLHFSPNSPKLPYSSSTTLHPIFPFPLCEQLNIMIKLPRSPSYSLLQMSTAFPGFLYTWPGRIFVRVVFANTFGFSYCSHYMFSSGTDASPVPKIRPKFGKNVSRLISVKRANVTSNLQMSLIAPVLLPCVSYSQILVITFSSVSLPSFAASISANFMWVVAFSHRMVILSAKQLTNIFMGIPSHISSSLPKMPAWSAISVCFVAIFSLHVTNNGIIAPDVVHLLPSTHGLQFVHRHYFIEHAQRNWKFRTEKNMFLHFGIYIALQT